ncbi:MULTISPECIES: class I SAM-dependent methyltransferase [Streptomyces]|uniref:class I SAM-dependent methyltransferase n=1 Tax=Streptomyces TaxID=1883 RepID=UPI0029BB69F5|nr:class I SAM-dependent methyltransferase [Streptomyces sp. ME02-6979A]MDX3346640.1 class I SAM-dependent methyltransferase [Streptomyces sp. ME02-6979A]WTE20901.1 class I SAM-dependent methyltransferase [Streptomyces anthocyanicus]
MTLAGLTPHRLVQALDRFNAAHPWDHNAHYHRWILRQLPRRFGSALDVGSGTGDLARLLATRADEVRGVDSDPAITAQARALTPEPTAASFAVADALTDLPAGPHDVITCVATLHHLPFTEALDTFREHMAPGGILVVVGLYRPRTVTDHLLGAGAVLPNAALGWLKNRGRAAAPPTSMTARTRPVDMAFPDIAAEAHTVLPGARLRRRLFWRYTLTWRRP